MAPVGTVWTYPGHPAGNAIRAAASYAGVDLKLVDHYVHQETNRTPEFIAKFPPGRIPAFEDAEGFYLTEATAIGRYIASLAPNSTLLGSNPKEAALVDQWISFSTTEIVAKYSVPIGFARGRIPYFKPLDTLSREKLTVNLSILENHLKTRTFLVGHRITLADITISATLQVAFKTIVDAPARQAIPNVVRFFNTVVNHPKTKPIFGEIEFIEKSIQYTPPVKAKETKPPKATPPAAAAPPKEKAPKPAKPAEDDDEEEEPLIPEEPKAKNPLDLLPKSNFNLEDWKRAYSNMDTRGPGGSLEWFYEKFDKEGFSLWKIQFKYNDELTLVFMSSNLIGGFYNRLEASRKYLFGSMGVLGSNNDSIITGVLILRGTDYKPVVEVAPDWESYDYEKIDLGNADQKAFFEAALAWDLEVGGKNWADGKNFK